MTCRRRVRRDGASLLFEGRPCAVLCFERAENGTARAATRRINSNTRRGPLDLRRACPEVRLKTSVKIAPQACEARSLPVAMGDKPRETIMSYDTQVALIRVGSAKALTRAGGSLTFQEPNDVDYYI